MEEAAKELALGVAVAGDWHRSVVGSLVEKREQAKEPDYHSKWALLALREAHAAARRRLEGYDLWLASVAIEGLAFVARPLGRLGVKRVRVVLLAIRDGDLEKAKAAWLAPCPSFDKRRSAFEDETLRSSTEEAQRAADWLAFEEKLAAIGRPAIVAAAPILCAALTPMVKS